MAPAAQQPAQLEAAGHRRGWAAAQLGRQARVALGRGRLGVLEGDEVLGRPRQRRLILAQPVHDLRGGAPEAERQQRGAQRARRRRAQRGRARGDLQVTGGLLVAAQAVEQPPERQPRRRGLVAAALRHQPLVEQAGLAQLAAAHPGARLVDRGAGAAVEHRGARPVPRAVCGARGLEEAAATREGVRDGAELVGDRRAVGDLGGARGQVRVERQAHGQPQIPQRHRQRQSIDEAPDAFVEGNGPPQLAAVGGDPRRLDVGAVGDQVLDDVVGGRFHDRDPASVAMILGVLGGSGLYDLDGLGDPREEEVSTPFGPPSAPVASGSIGSTRLLFLPRHGRGHRYAPSEINYRANVFALKTLGAERVLSVSAVGSLREGHRPRATSSCPISSSTRPAAAPRRSSATAWWATSASPIRPARRSRRRSQRPPAPGGRRGSTRGGTYVCMEGPQFSTRAESQLHRSWGADVIGMTAATEAKLAARRSSASRRWRWSPTTTAWHADEAPVSVESVIDVLRANVAGARDVVRRLGEHVATAAALWLRARRRARHHRPRPMRSRPRRAASASCTWEVSMTVNKLVVARRWLRWARLRGDARR